MAVTLLPVPAVFQHLDRQLILPQYQTAFGRAYCGDSFELIKQMPDESVNLIVTSPPYALIKKKAYGNKDTEDYVDWFLEFANDFHRILRHDGSLVLNIGGAYERGQPTRSLCHFEVLLRLCKDFGFHLAQEFYWYNPAKMPAPAEWVTIRRERVRDSVEPVWWLSKEPRPKANNRNVLTPYGNSMKELLVNGYNQDPRPSGHIISSKWGKDNGGAIPANVFEDALADSSLGEVAQEVLQELLTSNLIRLANTSSNDLYRRLCKAHSVKPHPATFPSGLPRFFVKFLTDPEDVVFDPFGGSGTVGAVAQEEGRYWITCELKQEYVDASRYRFPELSDD